MMIIFRLFQLAILIGLYSGIAGAETSTGCPEKQVAALYKIIDPWIRPATQGDEPILSLACKTWTSQPGLTITSAIFEPDRPRDESSPGAGDGTKEWVTVVQEKSSSRVLAIHRGQIEVDAAVRIHSESLSIDTAAYRLAPGIMAFGIRKNIGYSPNCADGGLNTFLTLFVYDQGKLRPVLGEPYLSSWTIDFESGHHPCGPETADYLLASGSTILRMLKTDTNGYHDIEFVTTVTTSWEKSEGSVAQYTPYIAKVIARYDGKRYVVPDWFAYTSAAEDIALRRAALARSRK